MTTYDPAAMERARIERNRAAGLNEQILETACRELAKMAGLDPDAIMVGPDIPWWQHFAKSHEYAIAAYLTASALTPTGVGVTEEAVERIDMQALVEDLVRECERAMKQRDEALADPTKRGADGRTHDTLFEFIVREHLTAALPALGRVQDKGERES